MGGSWRRPEMPTRSALADRILDAKTLIQGTVP